MHFVGARWHHLNSSEPGSLQPWQWKGNVPRPHAQQLGAGASPGSGREHSCSLALPDGLGVQLGAGC